MVTLFAQSQVHQHAELSWVMECTAAFGELRRMTQFKDKSERAEFVSAGLFTYPALMAADILLYDTDEVPVGDDQRQHVELVPRPRRPLQQPLRRGPARGAEGASSRRSRPGSWTSRTPTNKMSKSLESPQGTIEVLDDLKAVEKKVKRAVTDSDGEVRWDPKDKPGVTNLLSILGASTGQDPEALADRYDQYGPLKADTAEAVVELLRPVQARYAELAADPGAVDAILATGAAKARPHRRGHHGAGPRGHRPPPPPDLSRSSKPLAPAPVPSRPRARGRRAAARPVATALGVRRHRSGHHPRDLTTTTRCSSSRQSGERFEGVENFREWRRAHPADLAFETRRVRGEGDLWIVENSIRYGDGDWQPTVNILEFRGDKVASARPSTSPRARCGSGVAGPVDGARRSR